MQIRPIFLRSLPVLLTLAACTPQSGTTQEQVEPGSLADIEQRILADPANADLFVLRARYFESVDSMRLAYNDLKRAIALDSTDMDHHLALADLFYRNVRLDDSEEVLRKAIGIAPEATEPRLKLAELKLVGRSYVEAMDWANSALRIDPNLAHGYFLKGWIHMEAGDTALAVSSYRTAVEQDPGSHDAYVQLGQLHAARKDPLAMQYYATALELRPTSFEALYGLGMFAQETGQDSLALACYARIQEAHPRNALGWYNAGYVLLENKALPREARPYFDKAINANPVWPEAYYNRGLTYELDGRLDSALIDYRKALALAPDMTLAAQGLQRLQAQGLSVER